MTDLVVHPAGRPLVGSVPVPADASIARRAIVLASLAEGTTRLAGLGRGYEVPAIARALQALGVPIEARREAGELRIQGVGLFGLKAAAAPLECGESASGLALLCGALASARFRTQLDGGGRSTADEGWAAVVAPLRARGARIEGQSDPKRPGEVFPPLVVGPLGEDRELAELEYESPVARRRVKAGVLLSALSAHGVTRFREPTVSCDHTERLLSALGCPIRTAGSAIEIDPSGWSGQMTAFDLTIPGDMSAAAFLVAAAQLVEGSRVSVRDVGINPTRTGFLEFARDMGAGLSVEPQGERGGEPVALLHAWSAPLAATSSGGETVARGIDELPLLCVLAACARGTTRIRDAEGPMGEGAGRLAAIDRALGAFGVSREGRPGGFDIEGARESLAAADVDSGGDPAVAMAATVLGLAARGPSRVRNVGRVAASYPKFVSTLRALGASIEVVE